MKLIFGFLITFFFAFIFPYLETNQVAYEKTPYHKGSIFKAQFTCQGSKKDSQKQYGYDGFFHKNKFCI